MGKRQEVMNPVLLTITTIIIMLSSSSSSSSSSELHYGAVGQVKRRSSKEGGSVAGDTPSYCLSWRLAVESNNMQGWRTIPTQCLHHIQAYMMEGQYSKDVHLTVDQIYAYLEAIPPLYDGWDAWILDVDDTCLSNLFYYQSKRFGCDPYDPTAFRRWALKGECTAIPGVLELFERLIEAGFKVILLTGRDEETLGQVTVENLQHQGFFGYDRLVMRSAEYRGQSAITFKSEMRKQLMKQGYRVWGNVGDQWSDLQGDCIGNRTFKIPNPMYFVP